MSENFTDLSSLIDTPEDLPENLESADYTGFEIIPPGNYLSESREIKARRKDDGSVTFEVAFVGGLVNPETGKRVAGNGRPEKTYLSSKQYVRENRAGSTSSVSEYLRACGIDPKSVESVGSALAESQSSPVLVYVGWENRTEKQADGTWPKATLKTKDFNTGTKEQPNYVPNVTKDGVNYTARHRVTSNFQRVRS